MSKIPVTPVLSSEKSKMAQPNLDIRNGFDREKNTSNAAYFSGEKGGVVDGDLLSLWLATEANFNEIFKR